LLDELWNHFLELSNTRRWGPAGPLAITWEEIGWYNKECEVQLTVWEKLIIRRIDEVVVPMIGKRIKHRLSGKPDPLVMRADQPGMIRSFFQGLVKRKAPADKKE